MASASRSIPGLRGRGGSGLEPSVVRLTVRDGVVETEIVRLVTGDVRRDEDWGLGD